MVGISASSSRRRCATIIARLNRKRKCGLINWRPHADRRTRREAGRMPKFQPRNPDFRVTVERYVAAQRYLALLGVALNRVEPGLAEYELPYREDIGQAPWPSSNRPPPAAKKRPPKPAAEPPSPRSSRQGDGDPRWVERLPKAAFNKEEIFLMLMLSRRTSARHPRDPSFRDRSSGLRRSCAAG